MLSSSNAANKYNQKFNDKPDVRKHILIIGGCTRFKNFLHRSYCSRIGIIIIAETYSRSIKICHFQKISQTIYSYPILKDISNNMYTTLQNVRMNNINGKKTQFFIIQQTVPILCISHATQVLFPLFPYFCMIIQ